MIAQNFLLPHLLPFVFDFSDISSTAPTWCLKSEENKHG